jgi:hypothetical protein
MKKKFSLTLALFAVAAALPASAQTHPKTIGVVIRIKVKTGEGQQWEAGLKRFHAWEHEHNIPFTYYTWSIIAGKHTGQYYVGSFGHDWKDFDSVAKLDAEVNTEIDATVAPYTESIERSYYEFQPDVSAPVNPSQPPTPFTDLTFFQLKPGGVQAVMGVIKQVSAAIQKTNWPGGKSDWYELVDGGDYPQLVLATGHQNWADFQEPSPSFRAMLEKVYGKAGFEALVHVFDKNLQRQSGEILRYRTDLSYIASSK